MKCLQLGIIEDPEDAVVELPEGYHEARLGGLHDRRRYTPGLR
jgi:hypothetical protein